MSRRGARWGVLLVALAALPGCGPSDRPALPSACREGPGHVRAALARAPAEVRLGDTKLSDCFTESAEATDIQAVSSTFLAVAERLGDRARMRPEGKEALRLGYLIGAAQQGAAHTQGIHTEMVRRLELEATDIRLRSSAYRRGLRAGHEHG